MVRIAFPAASLGSHRGMGFIALTGGLCELFRFRNLKCKWKMSGLLTLGFITTFSATFSSVWSSYMNIEAMVVCLLADKDDLL